MIRNLKALGLALVAVLAMSVMAASAAQGAAFKSEAGTTFLSGSQVTENVFTTAAGKVKCKKATFSGEVTGTSVTELTIIPLYEECTAFGQSAKVTMEGCDYDFDVTTATTGHVKITCPPEKHITVHVTSGNCSLTIFGQTPGVPTVDFTNQGGPGNTRDVLVTSTVSQIEYTVDGPGTICGTAGTYKGAEGAKYDGTVTEKGANEGGTQVGVWVE
jgi:hypothetical protein